MLRIVLLQLCLVFGVFVSSTPSFAATVEYFGRDDCLHCRDQKAFLQKLIQEEGYQDVSIVYHDIYTTEGKALFDQVTTKSGLSKTTPITFIANRFIVGYQNDQTTGVRIRQLIDTSRSMDAVLNIQEYLATDEEVLKEMEEGGSCEDGEICSNDVGEFVFDLPFFGVVDLRSFSLPFLSIMLGFIDGFNPCAMYVLIMFITILLNTGSRSKLITTAGIFVIAEAIMYTLILTVWMTLWDFVGMNQIITPAVGTLALLAGGYFLYEWRYNNGTCRLISFEEKEKTKNSITKLVSSPLTIGSFIGIIGLAFSVNVIEFACSIGIPQAFTKILDLNMLDFADKAFYMGLYILFYMIDDFIVFGVAVYSFDKISGMNNYSRWSSGIGGVLMVILGLLLVFSPETLIVL